MDFKLVGSILLIVGTSIGAGMLALPIATAELGFIGSVILLFFCWFVMTMGALLILEVNLWMPQNSNLVSMAKKTIGPFGQIIAWLTYLLLLYSLLCAYIAGGSDLFRQLFVRQEINMPAWGAAVLFTLVFGCIVFFGIRAVDYVNRGLMAIKLVAYLILIALLTPLITSDQLVFGGLKSMASITAMTVTITSFGYSTIVPSLRIYFQGNIRKLKRAIFIGSLIPLVCYLFWDMVIMGVIPLHGEHGLIAILQSHSTTSDLVHNLNRLVSSSLITNSVQVFTSICVLTSFLGVALCLTDFLADGFQLEKRGAKNVLIQFMTFFPPLIVVLFFPNIFITALEYAGIYCVILLILLPACMAWLGRYRRHLATGYQVSGGKALLLFLIIFSLIMICWSIIGHID